MPTTFTDETVHALGELTLTYMFLDQVVTDLIIDLDEQDDELGARAQFIRVPFSKKLEKVAQQLEARLAIAPAATDVIARSRALLERARNASEHRHDLVHGHCFTDRQTKDIVIVNFGKDRGARIRTVKPEAIARVSNELGDVALAILAVTSEIRSALTAIGLYGGPSLA
jgi:hypothetical protein